MSVLRIFPGVLGRRAALQADRIRRDTLTQLAAALRADPDNRVRDALDALIDAVRDVDDCEGRTVDKFVQDLEDEAQMTKPVIAMSAEELQRVAREAAIAVNAGVVLGVPAQRGKAAA
ncbi:hypothetical protein OG896_25000 [Streptomyces sp. NBC_00669]|uniref:hypothetical protein n=1 Tax=Streptomyces sp. NBC_00669 TaxID=2976011 RepID=UPI002E3364CE|nr:hypothetical protein [Streptomyces sp. NBC_00669]